MTLVPRASTITPLRRFSQLASMADPLSRRSWIPSLGRSDRRRPRSGTQARGSPSNWSRGMTPSLLPPRSTKMLLPRTPMTLPVRSPCVLPGPGRDRKPGLPRPASAAPGRTSKVLGSNPVRAASSSASSSASHCRLRGTSVAARPCAGRSWPCSSASSMASCSGAVGRPCLGWGLGSVRGSDGHSCRP